MKVGDKLICIKSYRHIPFGGIMRINNIINDIYLLSNEKIGVVSITQIYFKEYYMDYNLFLRKQRLNKLLNECR